MVIHRNKHYYRYWFILIESMNEVSFKAYIHRPCSRDVPLRVKSKLTLVGCVRSPQGRSVTLLPRSERVSVGLVIVKVGRQWCPRSLSRREPPPSPLEQTDAILTLLGHTLGLGLVFLARGTFRSGADLLVRRRERALPHLAPSGARFVRLRRRRPHALALV